MNRAQLYFVAALLFALLVAVFVLQNTEPVGVNFLFWQFTHVSKVLVILVSAAVGALMVILLGAWWQFKKYIYVRQLESEIRELRAALQKKMALEKSAAPGGKEPEQNRQ